MNEQAAYRREAAEAVANDNAEALGWSIFFGGAVLGFIAGMLSIAIPAIVIYVIRFHELPL